MEYHTSYGVLSITLFPKKTSTFSFRSKRKHFRKYVCHAIFLAQQRKVKKLPTNGQHYYIGSIAKIILKEKLKDDYFLTYIGKYIKFAIQKPLSRILI